MEKRLLLMLVAVVLTAGIASAALIAYEPFTGTDAADVVGGASGTGWSGAWVDTTSAPSKFLYSEPGNTFDVLDTGDQKALFKGASGGTTARYNRTLSSAVTVDASNPDAWASALIEIGSGAGDVNLGRGIGVELTNGGSTVAGFGKQMNKEYGLGGKMSGTMTPAWQNSGVPANSVGVRFVVLHLHFDGTDTVGTVYVANGADQAGLDLSDVTTFSGTATVTFAGAFTFDGVQLYGYHASTTSNTIDEVRVADTYLDFFETPLANTPDPKNGDSALNTSGLSWAAPSTYAPTGYDVYFGTEPNVLNVNYDMATPIQVKADGTGTTIVDPAGAGTDLAFSTTYYWQVDSYEPNALGDDLRGGDMWSFTTVPPNVIIDQDPAGVTVAAGGVATISMAGSNVETYTWYKDGSSLTDGGSISGSATDTLTITGVQQSDEGFYSCEVSNSVPDSLPLITTSAQLMTERLVGHWEFEGNLTATVGTDATEVDPNETNAIAPAISYGSDADAAVGSGSLSLDNTDPNGEGGWLEIADSAAIYNFYPRGMTVSTWVKTPAGQSGEYNEIISKNFDDGSSRWFHRVAGTGGLFRFGGAGATTNGSISDGNWHLMVTTYDAATGIAQVYLDGEPKGSSAMSPTAEGNDANITIGGSALLDEFGAVNKDWGWTGFIDDVRVYSYPLTGEEVADLYGQPVCLYEFAGSTYDFNSDCVVNLLDFAMIAEVWQDSGMYYPAD